MARGEAWIGLHSSSKECLLLAHATVLRGLFSGLAARMQVNRIPIVHGSALFQLGGTQSLATATVGSPDDEQRMQGLLDADSRRLIVHFAFPPYAPSNVRHCVADVLTGFVVSL